MIQNRLSNFHLILASQSPRRQYLLKELGLNYEVIETHVREEYPDNLSPCEIATYLSELKAESLDASRLHSRTVIIAADTIVSLGNEILGKPSGYDEAVNMLKKLSGRKHDVFTGVTLRSKKCRKTFCVSSAVYFRDLAEEEILYYVDNFQPYDKAGSYGAQEWIGYIGITKIEGSYFNVMGLPVKELYEELLSFCLNNS